MPSVQVTGVLESPSTVVEANAEIKIVSQLDYGRTTRYSQSDPIFTDASGNYDFQLVYGKHLIAIKYDGSSVFSNLGTVSVSDELPATIDLITLLATSSTDPDPVLVTQLQQIAKEASQSAASALSSANYTQEMKEDVEAYAGQVSLDAQSASEDKQLAQQAAQTATQKAEQTEQDATATSQDRSAVSAAKLSVDENAQLVSEKSMLVEQLSSQTEQNAQVATEQAAIATEQAAKAEDLVNAATGGSLLKDANLSDLQSTTEARANLSVYSKQQVDTRLENKINAIALEVSANTFVYENGRLMQQSIEHGDGQETITYTYTNNVLTQAVSVRNGITKTTTYTYTDGRLIGVTTV